MKTRFNQSGTMNKTDIALFNATMSSKLDSYQQLSDTIITAVAAYDSGYGKISAAVRTLVLEIMDDPDFNDLTAIYNRVTSYVGWSSKGWSNFRDQLTRQLKKDNMKLAVEKINKQKIYTSVVLVKITAEKIPAQSESASQNETNEHEQHAGSEADKATVQGHGIDQLADKMAAVLASTGCSHEQAISVLISQLSDSKASMFRLGYAQISDVIPSDKTAALSASATH